MNVLSCQKMVNVTNKVEEVLGLDARSPCIRVSDTLTPRGSEDQSRIVRMPPEVKRKCLKHSILKDVVSLYSDYTWFEFILEVFWFRQ